MKFKIAILILATLCWGFTHQRGVFTNFQEALKTPDSVIVLKLNGCNGLDNVSQLESIKSFQNLTSLEISECPSVISLPNSIVSLPNLKELIFNWNGGSGEAVNWTEEYKKIFKLKQLEILVLGPYNDIGDLSSKICTLKSLRVLNLTMTTTTSLPKEIVKLTKLEEINLSMTRIEKLPAGMNHMKKLKKLDLRDTPLSKDDKMKQQVISEFKNCEIIW